jgi:hypothetical protein
MSEDFDGETQLVADYTIFAQTGFLKLQRMATSILCAVSDARFSK